MEITKAKYNGEVKWEITKGDIVEGFDWVKEATIKLQQIHAATLKRGLIKEPFDESKIIWS